MSKAQHNRHVENLIAEWRELSENWDGKNIWHEQKMNDVGAELEEYGIIVEDLD